MRVPPPSLAGPESTLRLGDLTVDRPYLIIGLQPIAASPASMNVEHPDHDTSGSTA
jgi:hypothetical protein